MGYLRLSNTSNKSSNTSVITVIRYKRLVIIINKVPQRMNIQLSIGLLQIPVAVKSIKLKLNI
jgi:hypothetical protein